MDSWSAAPFSLWLNMLAPNVSHNPFFHFVTVDELPPLPVLSLTLPLPHPPLPRTNLPPLSLMVLVLLGLDDELVEWSEIIYFVVNSATIICCCKFSLPLKYFFPMNFAFLTIPFTCRSPPFNYYIVNIPVITNFYSTVSLKALLLTELYTLDNT